MEKKSGVSANSITLSVYRATMSMVNVHKGHGEQIESRRVRRRRKRAEALESLPPTKSVTK